MALRFEQASASVWALYSDNTRLLEINGANIIIGGLATLKVHNSTVGQAGSALANVVGSTVSGLRVAVGVLTTASASDTVVTGLTTVTACFATFSTDPADANIQCSATIGDQAGTPAAGSILVKTWKTADGADVTPVAASTFSKLVNWMAVGL